MHIQRSRHWGFSTRTAKAESLAGRICHKSSKIQVGSEEWSLSEVSVVIPRDLCNFFRHCHDSERLGRRVDGEPDPCPARERLLLPDVYRPQRGRRQVVL